MCNSNSLQRIGTSKLMFLNLRRVFFKKKKSQTDLSLSSLKLTFVCIPGLFVSLGSLIYCILRNFSCFLSSADFFQNYFFEKILSRIPSECQTVWTLIRPDEIVGPDLGPNCFPRLSADDTGRQRVTSHVTRFSIWVTLFYVCADPYVICADIFLRMRGKFTIICAF